MAGGQAMAASSDDIDDFRSTGRSANEWRLIRNDRIHAIKSYDKLDEGKSLRNFRVESDVDADFNTIAKVYFDFANYPKWFHKCQQAKLLLKVSSTSGNFPNLSSISIAISSISSKCKAPSNLL